MVQRYTQILLPEDSRLDGANPATVTTSSGTLEHTTLDFGSGDTAYYPFRAVALTNGPVYIDIDWYSSAGSTSGTVVWEVSFGAITPNQDSQDAETKTVGAINYVQDTHLGTTGKRVHRATITATSIDGLNVDDIVWMKIERDSGSAPVSDTMTGDAAVLLISIRYVGV